MKQITQCSGCDFAMLGLIVTCLLSACGGNSGSTENKNEEVFIQTQSVSDSHDVLPQGGTQNHSRQKYVNELSEKIALAYSDAKRDFDDQERIFTQFCADENRELTESDLRNAWQRSMSSWQKVRAINFGPAEEKNRQFYIQNYPVNWDNLNERMTALILGEQALNQELILSQPASVRGLTSLEVILYSANTQNDTFSGDFSARYCDFSVAVTQILNRYITEIQKSWSLGGEYFAIFTHPENIEKSLEHFFGGWIENLEITVTQRLLSPAGGALKNIESPHAQRSLINISESLESLANYFLMESDTGIDQLLKVQGADSISEALVHQVVTIEGHFPPEELGIEQWLLMADGYDQIRALADEFEQLGTLLESQIATALNIAIGFNSHDGD